MLFVNEYDEHCLLLLLSLAFFLLSITISIKHSLTTLLLCEKKHNRSISVNKIIIEMSFEIILWEEKDTACPSHCFLHLLEIF